MGLVDEFVAEYERQFDFWEAAARRVHRILEDQLASSGLRGLVTSRAKSPERLRAKLVSRGDKHQYTSAEDIREDIADLAGVRVALYFPGQMDEVERIIRSELDVQLAKFFPTNGNPASSNSSSTDDTTAVRRFSGYSARHFRVFIPKEHLADGQDRYASAIVEIQVASVLMHAWSEVEHDLIYKPLSGTLSESEFALLDQLNGLMLAGEVALEQLQRAGEVRVSAKDAKFDSHFELAEFLRTRLAGAGVKLTDATLGRVDVFFDYLMRTEKATVDEVGRYLDSLTIDFEQRPVADQLADVMLAGNKAQYEAYLRTREQALNPRQGRGSRLSAVSGLRGSHTLAIGEFVTAWVLLELMLRELLPEGDERPLAAGQLIETLNLQAVMTPAEYDELQFLRRLRNQVVHGRESDMPSGNLREAAEIVRRLTNEIRRRYTER